MPAPVHGSLAAPAAAAGPATAHPQSRAMSQR